MFWTWDLETVDWDQPLCAVAVSEKGDVERFFGDDSVARVVDHMKKTRGVYGAHFGGGFDIPLALNVHLFRKIILTGSNILCAEDKHSLTLRDTYPWFLNSLAKIGKALGFEKDESVDRTNLLAHTEKEILDYCQRDCEVLMQGVQGALAFLGGYGARAAWTAGASAMSLLRALEPGTWHAMQDNKIPVETVRSALDAGVVQGGRVEGPARGYVPRVFAYDIKSSYPSQYATRDLPLGMRPATRKDRVGVWRCRWVWHDRWRVPPALDQATHAGVGPCEGWLIDDEIAALEECGVPVNRFEGWAPNTMVAMGQEFVRVLYAEKERGSFFAKVWINSAHGKWSEHPLKDCYTKYRPSEYFEPEGMKPEGPYWHWAEIKCDDKGFAAPHCQPLASALTLGRARVKLWRIIDALQRAGWEVYYWDTDSIFTNCPPERMPVPLGKELGMLAYEAGPCEGYFLGPKAYLLINEFGEITKQALKGVPLKSYNNAVEDDGVIREAKRARPATPGRPARDAEVGTDLRLEVFRRALTDKGARCMKDGVTSFLTGLHGVKGADGKRREVHWGRHPLERVITVCGRGKAHGELSTDWCYLSTLEMVVLHFLADLIARPRKSSLWDRQPANLKELCLSRGYVRFTETQIHCTDAGKAFHNELTIGDRKYTIVTPDVVDIDDDDDN